MDVVPLRLAIAQTNPTVGDLQGNSRALVAWARESVEAGADVLISPELSLVGYPPRDLLDAPGFVAGVRGALDALRQALPPTLLSLVGFVDRVDTPVGPTLRNAVAAIRGGRIEAVVHKRLLPCYDVFDEPRWFGPGHESPLVEVRGRKLGITICEDAWNTVETVLGQRRYAVDPIRDVVDRGADLVLNLAASPFTRGKWLGRARMLADVARAVRRPVVFVNQVGGHDDLIFDGSSTVFDAEGREEARLPAFESALRIVTLGQPSALAPKTDEDDAVIDALTLGVRDFARRVRLERLVVGLSGGLDSALVGALAARALGGDRVIGLAMPSRYSSQHSLDDAAALARAIGCVYRVVPIEPMFGAVESSLTDALDALAPGRPGDVTFENAQARLRCLTLMAAANRLSALLLNTGNKSEIACGYCTLYGDMAGGLSVIGDVFKTEAYALCRALNRQAGHEIIPRSTIEKPPSAELRPDQKDVDSLPPYEVLDPILRAHVEERLGLAELVARGFEPALAARVVAMVRGAEHKRRQLPPTLIVTGKAFSIGRRMPIAATVPA